LVEGWFTLSEWRTGVQCEIQIADDFRAHALSHGARDCIFQSAILRLLSDIDAPNVAPTPVRP